jgi:hypothetical protein
MTTEHILTLLIQERDRLNRAIEALQGPAKRRGRPPKNPVAGVPAGATAPISAAPARKKRTFTAAQRKQQAERMKKYWARKKKAAK